MDDRKGTDVTTQYRPKRKFVAALVFAAAGILAVGTVTAAAQTGSSGAKATRIGVKVSAAGKRPVTQQPADYRIVQSPGIPAAAGAQTQGSIACPVVNGVQTKPTGGGAFVPSSSIQANMSSSYPSGSGWAVTVDNTTASPTLFQVYAICSQANAAYYSVQSAPFDSSPFCQCFGQVNCPSGYQTLGGGVSVDTTDVNVNINSIAGFGGYFAVINNDSADDAPSTVYAICSAGLPGYTIVGGPGNGSLPGEAQGGDTARCPVVSGIQTSVLSGGQTDSSFSIQYDMNSNYPSSTTSFTTVVNVGNPNDGGEFFQAVAICAY